MSENKGRISRKINLIKDRLSYEKGKHALDAAAIVAYASPDFGVEGTAASVLAAHLRATPAGVTLDGRPGDDSLSADTDWYLEDHFGVRWPRRYVGAMSDHLEGSDLVLLWHKNKMQGLLGIAGEFERTTDPAVAERWYGIVRGWCAQNPLMVGMNWRSPMETGTRLVVWSQCLARLREAALPDEDTCREILGSVIQQFEFLAGNFSDKDVPNNHLIGEAATLYAAATYWPVLAASAEWRDRAERFLVHEAERQMLSDGVQYECAVNYHLYVLDFLLVYLHAKALRGEEPPQVVLDATRACADTALRLMSPTGRFPRIGDDSLTEFLALRPLAELESTRFENKVFASELIHKEYVWLLCNSRWGTALTERSAPVHHRHRFKDAGWMVLRGENEHAVFTAGPQHTRTYSPGHLHTDAGSFELELDGTPLFVDSGTYLYFYDQATRDHMRSAAAHNTLLVDGVDPGKTRRWFAWEHIHAGRMLATGGFEGSGPAFAACERQIPGADDSLFVHRRMFVRAHPCWLVADLVMPVSAPGAHSATAMFHIPFTSERVVVAGDRKVEINTGATPAYVDVFSSGGHIMELVDGADDIRGRYSTHYGEIARGCALLTTSEVSEQAGMLHVIRGSEASVVACDWWGARVDVELAFDGGGGRRVSIAFDPILVGVDGIVVGQE